MGSLDDPSSQSNPGDARIVHMDLELDVDFDSKTIAGYVRHEVSVQSAGAAELHLDTSGGLQVQKVLVDGAVAATWTFDAPAGALGSRLRVPLPPGLTVGATVGVEVWWCTGPGASALQFLTPEQTAGGKKPYLFTQCQAIHARSLLPCQDAPAAKATYSAAVRVPAGLVALMSALSSDGEESAAGQTQELARLLPRDGTGDSHSKQKKAVFRFHQPMPISSYLIALAVGELESRELSPVSRVWSEPSMVEAGAAEFADTPAFIAAAESVAGPYIWTRYDLLLLPPSFPYGGMENPCLTFVTPTLLAGDKVWCPLLLLYIGLLFHY
jgi:leukotriene-A4 hydrolase